MDREGRYADLHCHPQGRAFNFLRNTEEYNGPRYHPWTVILPNLRQQAKGARAFSYSQCDLAKLQNGNGRLIFASLYPFERGFFKGGGKLDKEGVNRLLRILRNLPAAGFLFRRIARALFSSEEGTNSAKDYFQAMLMRMPMERVNFIQSEAYDYYQELLEEYRFLQARNDLREKAAGWGSWIKRLTWKLFPHKNGDASVKAEGTYSIATNAQDVTDGLAMKKIVFVITIEGMHSLGTDKHLPEVMKRIEAIKNWSYPVFFITFSHHFNNNLSGHAHSLPGEATLFTDQREGMNGPFNDLGKAAARYLLSLDDTNTHRSELGRKILIDLKHTSATSRKQYYEEIVTPCIGKGNTIPVIASHVGYSGVKTLDELIRNYDREVDDYQVAGNLNGWNINVCDEDIEMILKTNGLLGLCLDQRILGQMSKGETNSKVLLWNNLRGILEAVVNSSLPEAEKARVWSVLTLGTDFEGYIDPADNYATALQYTNFEADLLDLLQREIVGKGLSARYFISHTPQEIVDKVCFGNAYEFVRRNFV